MRQNLTPWLKKLNRNEFEYSKDWCANAICIESSSPSVSPSTTPSSTLDKNICERKNRKECNTLRDNCAYGPQKIFQECVPKKRYEHSCSQYHSRFQCSANNNNEGLCSMKRGVCSHICDNRGKRTCKKLKQCKALESKNSCMGCMPKAKCS